MKHSLPRGLNRRGVERLLSQAKNDRMTGGRIVALSRQFLGHRYEANPLIGSVDTPEVFTASLDGFDCVTYIETTMALALASDVESFTDWLRDIRYEKGHIQWERRNHYMSAWIRNNVRTGIMRLVSMRGLPIVSRVRVLNVIPGLAAQRIRVKCIPKRAVPRLEPHLQSGDLIFFASTRKNLDVFHAGIIMRDGNRIRMRHASRSQGGVVEQGLREFLKSNRMAGVIVVRPQQVARRIGVGN